LGDITGPCGGLIEVDPGRGGPHFREVRRAISTLKELASSIVCIESAVLRSLRSGAGERTKSHFCRRERRDAAATHATRFWTGSWSFFRINAGAYRVPGLESIAGRNGRSAGYFEGVCGQTPRGVRQSFWITECYGADGGETMARSGADRRHTRHQPVGMVTALGRNGDCETSVAVIVTAPHRKAAFEQRSKESTV